MKRPSPCLRDISVDHGAKAAFFKNRAHVDVDQEQAYRDERHTGVNQNRGVANKPEAPWKRFRVPQDDAGEE